MRIARRLDVPLVADFRDAWRDNPGNVWSPSVWHRRRQLALERQVLSAAAAVTSANPITGEIQDLRGPAPELIPNGFDRAEVPAWSPDSRGPLVVTFMGTIYSITDPLPVLEALRLLRATRDRRDIDIRLRIVGRWPSYVEGVVAELGLEDVVEFWSYRPHAEALAVVAASDVGLIVLADLALAQGAPAKLYEYLGIGLPVLYVGPVAGHAQDLIAEAEAGIAVPYGDIEAIADALVRLAVLKQSGNLAGARRPEVVARYERQGQASTLAALFERVTAGTALGGPGLEGPGVVDAHGA
jgi:glycosyltransferase involved in cell wall biosynthesis